MANIKINELNEMSELEHSYELVVDNGTYTKKFGLDKMMKVIKITDLSTTLGDVKDIVDEVNENGEHVQFDFANLGTRMYLCTITFDDNNCKVVDLVTGRIAETSYDEDKLLNVVLANASEIATQHQIDYLQREIDELGGSEAIKDLSVLGDLIESGASASLISAGDTIDINWVKTVVGTTLSGLTVSCTDEDKFINGVSECEDKDYIFVYDGTSWNYNEQPITISEFGISVSGTIPTGEVMTIHVTPNPVKYTFTGYDDMTPENSAVPHNWLLEQTYAPDTKVFDTYEIAFLLANGKTLNAGNYKFTMHSTRSNADIIVYFNNPANIVNSYGENIDFASQGYTNVDSQYIPNAIRPYREGTLTAIANQMACSKNELENAIDLSTVDGITLNTEMDQLALGNNNWEYSNLRQWLNDDSKNGTFEKSQPFDKPSTYNLTKGFLYGLDPRVKNLMLNCKTKYTAGYSSYQRTRGTIYEVVDKVFLLSMKEMSFDIQTGEGNVSDLYNEYTEGVLTNNAVASRVKLNKAGGSVNNYRWSRSANSGYASYSYSVTSSGAYSNNSANNSFYFAPAFIIGKPSSNQ